MRLSTFNSFGKITISKRAIAKVASISALDCYGVLDLAFPFGFNVLQWQKNYTKGVTITNTENEMVINIYAVFKYGVAISAVSESIKKSVKYNVENFTGMLVSEVNIHVVGVRV